MKIESLRLIVLIPHRDVLKPVDAYRRKLFENGFSGAYSFPGTIPLILTKNPYTAAELKQTALFLRAVASGGKYDGKFTSKNPEIIHTLPGVSLGGVSFDISLDGLKIKEKAAALPGISLGLTILKPGTEKPYLRFSEDFPAPSISFRAGAAANMVYNVLENGSYSWEIGHPVWLPSHKGKKDA